MVLRHERLAGLVAQHAAFTAHGLADQEGLGARLEQAGRVELEELHVRERGPGAIRHRHAVARRDVGVARVEVDLPGAAGREKGDARAEALHGPARVEDVGAEGAVRARQADALGSQQIHGAAVFEDLDVRVGARAGEQGALDLAPGGVAVVEHATPRVAALAAEREAVRLAIEADPRLDQRVDGRGPALDHEAHDLLATEARAGPKCVLHVGLERVVVGHDRRDAALREVGGGVGGLLLGHDGHAPALGHLQRVEEAGNAASEHEEIDLAPVALRHRSGPPAAWHPLGVKRSMPGRRWIRSWGESISDARNAPAGAASWPRSCCVFPCWQRVRKPARSIATSTSVASFTSRTCRTTGATCV